MKNYLFLALLFSIFTFTSCKKDGDGGSRKITISPKKSCKSLLIIAEDRSGSTTDHRKLNENDYLKIFNQFQENANGQMAVRVIGNPAPAEREFFMLPIKGQKQFKVIPKDALMSQKGKLRKLNEEIAIENIQISKNNLTAIKGFIANNVTKHILNYKPHKNKDITNIQDALHHLELKVHEPTFRNYDNINILIVSDGIHDATKLKNKLVFNPEVTTNLFLIGWKDKSVFKNISNVESFESVNGFIEYYKTITCK